MATRATLASRPGDVVDCRVRKPNSAELCANGKAEVDEDARLAALEAKMRSVGDDLYRAQIERLRAARNMEAVNTDMRLKLEAEVEVERLLSAG